MAWASPKLPAEEPVDQDQGHRGTLSGLQIGPTEHASRKIHQAQIHGVRALGHLERDAGA